MSPNQDGPITTLHFGEEEKKPFTHNLGGKRQKTKNRKHLSGRAYYTMVVLSCCLFAIIDSVIVVSVQLFCAKMKEKQKSPTFSKCEL